MVEKFEVGKFYVSNWGDVPFYVREIIGEKAVIEQSRVIFPEREQTVNLSKMGRGYYSAFREVSREEVEELVRRLGEDVDFLKNRLG